MPRIDPILSTALIIKSFNDPPAIAVPVIKNSASKIYCNSKLKYSVHNDKIK